MKYIPIIILGAGNSTIEIIDQIKIINKKNKDKLKIVGILDDDTKLHGKKLLNIPILDKIKNLKKFKKEKFFLSMFHYKNRFKRAEIINSCRDIINRFITIIHPDAIIGSEVKIGRGSFISNNCTIYSYSKIGNFCTISSNSSLATNSEIKKNCYIGYGSVITYNSIKDIRKSNFSSSLNCPRKVARPLFPRPCVSRL